MYMVTALRYFYFIYLRCLPPTCMPMYLRTYLATYLPSASAQSAQKYIYIYVYIVYLGTYVTYLPTEAQQRQSVQNTILRSICVDYRLNFYLPNSSLQLIAIAINCNYSIQLQLKIAMTDFPAINYILIATNRNCNCNHKFRCSQLQLNYN